MAKHLSVETPVGTLAVRALGASGRPVALLWHSLFVDDRSWGRVEPDFAADHAQPPRGFRLWQDSHSTDSAAVPRCLAVGEVALSIGSLIGSQAISAILPSA